MSDSSRTTRQYLALALLVLLYVGGIIGWSYSMLGVDPPSPSGADTTLSPKPDPNRHLGAAPREWTSGNNGDV